MYSIFRVHERQNGVLPEMLLELSGKHLHILLLLCNHETYRKIAPTFLYVSLTFFKTALTFSKMALTFFKKSPPFWTVVCR